MSLPERVPAQTSQSTSTDLVVPTKEVEIIPSSETKKKDIEKYISRHRADGTPEEILARRKKRKRIMAAIGAVALGIPAIFGGIALKNAHDHNTPPPPAKAGAGASPDTPTNTNQQKTPNKPHTITTTITVQEGDSEWNISQNSLKQATGTDPTMPTVNAATMLNAGMNMQTGLAKHPDDLATGQQLVILDADAIKLINESANNPSAHPALSTKLKQLNSHLGSIEQAAKSEQATIDAIQKDLAEELAETPIYNKTTTDLNQQPYHHAAFSFDTMWENASVTAFVGTQKPIFSEQSLDAYANESAIPSREISRLRKTTEQVIFSRPATNTKQNLTLAA